VARMNEGQSEPHYLTGIFPTSLIVLSANQSWAVSDFGSALGVQFRTNSTVYVWETGNDVLKGIYGVGRK